MITSKKAGMQRCISAFLLVGKTAVSANYAGDAIAVLDLDRDPVLEPALGKGALYARGDKGVGSAVGVILAGLQAVPVKRFPGRIRPGCSARGRWPSRASRAWVMAWVVPDWATPPPRGVRRQS